MKKPIPSPFKPDLRTKLPVIRGTAPADRKQFAAYLKDMPLVNIALYQKDVLAEIGYSRKALAQKDITLSLRRKILEAMGMRADSLRALCAEQMRRIDSKAKA